MEIEEELRNSEIQLNALSSSINSLNAQLNTLQSTCSQFIQLIQTQAKRRKEKKIQKIYSNALNSNFLNKDLNSIPISTNNTLIVNTTNTDSINTTHTPITPKIHFNQENNLPFLTKIVTTSNEIFNQFIYEWKQQSIFSFSLIYITPFDQCSIEIMKKGLGEEEDPYCFLPNQCQICGICISWSPHSVYIISLQTKDDEIETFSNRWEVIRERFMNPKSTKILWNMKPQLKIFLAHSIQVKGTLLDPKIAVWILNTDRNKEKTLDQITQEYVNGSSKNIIEANSEFEIACLRTHYSLILMQTLWILLSNKPEDLELFLKIEMPIVPILVSMEYNGFGFIDSICQKGREEIETKLQYLENQAYKLAGRTFSLGKPLEVAEILFQKLKLPFVGQEKYMEQKYREQEGSTSERVLNKLKYLHPLPDIILQHRKLSLLLQRYLDILNKYAFFDTRFQMKRIFSTISQTTVPTGRLAFDNPNLQAIAHPVSFDPVKDELNPNPKPVIISVRGAFIATEDCLLVSFDYSQLEIRITAHLSNDFLLKQTLQSGGDVFCQLASQWLEKPLQGITERERQQAKHIIYGVVNGMGLTSVAEILQVSKPEAETLISSFKGKYQGVQNYLKSIVQVCEQNGFVSTMLGRKRYLPAIHSKGKTKSRAERQAVSAVLQGSAADLMKMAMIKVEETLQQANLPATLVLQVHDELIFEIKESQVVIIANIIKQIMENAMKLSVATPVNVSLGKSWGNLNTLIN